MKRVILTNLVTAFLFTLNIAAFAQTKAAYKKVKEFYLEKGASSKKVISYNDKSQELTLGKFSIPIRRVNFSYEGKNEEVEPKELYRVKVSCPVPHACILHTEEGTEFLGIVINFSSKDDCLTFIRLLSALKEAAVLVKE